MSPLTRKDSRHGRRKREILRAASEVFAALGDLPNMLLIAESAGVTEETLYAHFGSKAQLLQAVIEYWMKELPEPALTATTEGDLRTQLDKVARELLRQAAHPAALALARILSRSGSIPPKRWRQRHRPYRVHLEKTLSQCPRCNDPAQAASQFLLLAVGSLDPSTATPADQSRVAAAVALFVQAYSELESAVCE